MIAFALAAFLAAPAHAAEVCPMEGETAQDCPWADVGRAAAAAPDARSALALIRSSAPDVAREFQADAKRRDLLSLWGKSVNFDEHAKATIVEPRILEAIGVKNGHAGLTHTYGYLFSTLKTPYGFKRARWVSGEIERGLGLPPATFAPVALMGTLLSNVTAFAGGVAFRTDVKELARAKKIRKFDVSALKIKRLSETVALPGGRRVVIRTDLVSYVSGPGSLLIYSYRDGKTGRAFLITMFPVVDGFVQTLLDPKGLGENLAITARYNADIDGVTGVTSLTGSRRVE
jgi:hypothetical protein